MQVTIIAEKPSQGRWLLPQAHKHWPGADITIVHAVPYGNIKFGYPRGLKYSEFPFLSEPVNRLRAWNDWCCPPVLSRADGTSTPLAMSAELITQADIILGACDPDSTGALAFDIIMAEVFGDDRAATCPSLRLLSMDQKSIEKGFCDIRPFGESGAASLEWGYTKRYFDWNWNVNSQTVLGSVQRWLAVPENAPPMSKFALQLLYALKKLPPMTGGRLVQLMQSNWQGTGRYTYKKNEWRPRLGSPASVMTIVENLQAAGFVREVDSAHNLKITELGLAYLAQLHPDCEDADLPFRLDEWCKHGLEVAKPAIDRYIRTVFGKQMRFKAGGGA